MPKITTIEALPALERKKRVAGYSRVSSGKDAMLHSLSSQVSYFSTLIQAHNGWVYAGVYADEAKTGTKESRSEFQRLMDDCRAGNIDMVITKSVSRFARNTVTLLESVRELKALGVDIFFEEQNLHTMSGDGELMLTILASYAQEESRSISENITWGQRRSFESGKVHLAYGRFLGYDKGEDGNPTVNADQAVVVELIYRLFLDGKTACGICRELEERSIPAPGGGSKWPASTVESILTNEKYKGDALLQKTYTTDFLEKTKKVNAGEVPQYYVEDSHEAIINPDIWAQVQTEFARRKMLGRAYSGKSTLCAKLVCEDCGAFYGRKVWHSTDVYKKEIWQCNAKFKNAECRCRTPIFSTVEIQEMFIRAYNQQMKELPRIVEDCKLMCKTLTDFTELDAAIEQKTDESEVVAGMVRELVKQNASTAIAQDEYTRKYDGLSQRYEYIINDLNSLKAERTLREQKDKAMGLYIRTLRKSPQVLTEWNNTLWTVLVEKAIAHRDKSITFVFYNGNEVRI